MHRQQNRRAGGDEEGPSRYGEWGLPFDLHSRDFPPQGDLTQEHRHVHPLLGSLKDVVIDQKQLYLIFEHLEKDLKTHLDELKSKSMEQRKVKLFLYQMLSGIADCHMKRIIHRDLKPANILLDSKGTTAQI